MDEEGRKVTIPGRLAAIMRWHGLTQRDLATLAGTGQSTVSRILAGKREAGPVALAKIATALGVSPEAIGAAVGCLGCHDVPPRGRRCTACGTSAASSGLVPGTGGVVIGKTKVHRSRKMTHCRRGHEFTEENTGWTTDGRRRCRACAAFRGRGYREKPKPALPILGLPEKVWRQLLVRDCGYETPCLVWTGALSQGGYGVVSINRRQYKVHRLVFEVVEAAIPGYEHDGDRIVSDHLCRNRACANPEHIEPVTDAVNVLRGVSFSSVNAAKTQCIHGHEFTPENTRITSSGGRECRTCRRAYEQRKDAAKRAAARARRTGAEAA